MNGSSTENLTLGFIFGELCKGVPNTLSGTSFLYRNGVAHTMASSKKVATLTAALSVAAGGFVPGIAVAEAAPANSDVVIGPGSPLRMPFPSSKNIDGRHVQSPMCSLGVPGTVVDQNGVSHRVIMTAGHCVVAKDTETGEEVTGQFFIPTKDGDKLVNKDYMGTDVMPEESDFDENTTMPEFFNELFNSGDYGIIEVQDDIKTTSMSHSVDEFGNVHGEPVQIVGIEDKRTLDPMEISVDNFGEPVCTDGSRTGRGCGFQVFRVRNGVWAIAPIDHGDSGGNAYNPETREAIGVNSMGIGPLSRFQPIDVALEEQYDIPDGQVNERFKVETSTEPQSEFRTIDEDVQYTNQHVPQEEPDLGPIGELLPEGVEVPPEIADIISESPALPELPIPELSGSTAQATQAVSNLSSQAGLPSLF